MRREMRLKHIARIAVSNVDKKSADEERPVRLCNYTDVYYNERISSNLEFMSATASNSQVREFRLCPGDVLITKDSETPDDIAVPALVEESADDLVCGYHLALIRPDQTLVAPRYLFWVLASTSTRSWFSAQATGVTRFGLRAQSIGDARLNPPSLRQQRKIADFLDAETSRIDALGASRRRMTQLLEERRGALITNAVTGGLEVEGRTRDSGLPWLGALPDSWIVRRLKTVCSAIRDGTHLPPPRVVEGVPILSVRNMIGRRFVLRPDDSHISREDFEVLQRSFDFREGDVLLAIVGATLGKTAIVDRMAPFTLQRSVAAFRPRSDEVDYRFLRYWLETTHFQRLLWSSVGFSAQPGVYLGALGDFRLPVPPRQVQARIADFLDAEMLKLDLVIQAVNRQLALLTEHRQALITAAVTGQLDVSKAAA